MADIMNRGDLIDTVAAECDLPSSKVNDILKSFEGAIARSLAQGGEVRIAGFGTFKTSARSARTSRNPRTGEPVEVPARTAARFIAGKGLKTAAEGAGKSPAPTKEDASAKADAKPTKAAKGGKTATAKSDAPAKEESPAVEVSAKAEGKSAKKAAPKAEAKADKGAAKKKK